MYPGAVAHFEDWCEENYGTLDSEFFGDGEHLICDLGNGRLTMKPDGKVDIRSDEFNGEFEAEELLFDPVPPEIGTIEYGRFDDRDILVRTEGGDFTFDF